MQQNVNKYVRISDISAYLLCPRLAYFRRRHDGPDNSPEIVRAAVFKEISRSLAGVMAAADPEASLRIIIEDTCKDAEIVYGLPSGPIMEEALDLAADIITGLSAESARIGKDRLLSMLSPCERPQAIYSDRLRISGTIDRIVVLDGKRCPVVACTSKAPENGIYSADRLRLAACAMLTDEKYGISVDHGIVEYICGWRIREAGIRRSDRMAVLSARNRIMQAGTAMPDAKRGTWCTTCQFASTCNVHVTLIDRLFRP